MSPPPKEAKHKVSIGERAFDIVAYAGIGGIGAFLATIPIAFHVKYGLWAEKFKSASGWLQKRWGMSAGSAEQTLMATATMQGGNLMVPIILVAENNKTQIVESINTMVGDKTDISVMKDAPEQTWGSLLGSRAMAWITVFTSFMVASKFFGPQFKAFEEKFAEKFFCKPLGLPLKEAGRDSGWFNVGKIASLDTFATAAATGLLYGGSRLLAVAKKKKPVLKDEPAAPLPPLAPPIMSEPVREFAGTQEKPARLLHQQKVLHSRSEEPGFVAAL